MSGGSYEYCYLKIEEMADTLMADTPLRRVFKKHLYLVAQACHDIEWVDSGDYGKADDEESIRECLGENADKLVLSELIDQALNINKELEKAITKAKKE